MAAARSSLRGRLQDRRQDIHRPDHQAQGVSQKPDVLYVAAKPDDIGLVVKQMRQAGLTAPDRRRRRLRHAAAAQRRRQGGQQRLFLDPRLYGARTARRPS